MSCKICSVYDNHAVYDSFADNANSAVVVDSLKAENSGANQKGSASSWIFLAMLATLLQSAK